MQEVGPGIFFTDSYPGTTVGAIILTGGIIFIDAPLHAEDAEIWKLALLNRSRGAIYKLLVNLDAHPDRTAGAKAMDVSAIAQQKAAERISKHAEVFRGQLPPRGSEWEKYPDMVGVRWTHPNLTYTEQISFHWGDPTVVMEHHPGPCPGASWVIVPEHQVVFVGDAALEDVPPFLAEADIPQWLETLDVLTGSDCKDFTIISGRGGIISPDVIKKQRKSLRKLHRRIEKLAKKNAPPEAVSDLATTILDDFSSQKEESEFHLKRLRHGLYQYYMRHYVSET